MEHEAKLMICRICLEKINSTEKAKSVTTVLNLLNTFTSVMIREDDGLPSSVCQDCYRQANEVYAFLSLCEESDKKLRNGLVYKFNDCTFKENLECSVKLEPNDDCISSEFLACDDNNSFVETKLKNEFSNTDDEIVFSNSKHSGSTTLKRDKYNKKHVHLLKHKVKRSNESKCDTCGKLFTTAEQFQNHVKIHNRKGSYLCQTCGKQFTMPENLIRHQRIHTGIRPFKCKLCSKAFTQSNELKSHLITHSSEKSHLCSVCGHKFSRKASLQVHMRRLHSSASLIRPYPCEICEKTFKDKRDLSQHILIHKEERKYICSYCEKAFKRSSNLKVHERIHTGYRPFACHICSAAFNQKHVLNTHLQKHNNTVSDG